MTMFSSATVAHALLVVYTWLLVVELVKPE